VTRRSYQRNGVHLLNQDVDLDNPRPVAPNKPNDLTAPIHRQVDTAAAYLLDTIKLNPQWTINGGIRLDHFERNDRGPVNANPNDDPNGLRQDTLFNWNVGIVYKPLPIAALHAAYATSSNPVGQELDATQTDNGGLSVALTGLEPEKNTAIEVGTKWQLFNRHLLATVALFQTEKENAREPSPLGGTNPPTASGASRCAGWSWGPGQSHRAMERLWRPGGDGNGGDQILDPGLPWSRARQHSQDPIQPLEQVPTDRGLVGRWSGDLRQRGL
jgi:outer membrane receptor for monomeric catechols